MMVFLVASALSQNSPIICIVGQGILRKCSKLRETPCKIDTDLGVRTFFLEVKLEAIGEVT